MPVGIPRLEICFLGFPFGEPGASTTRIQRQGLASRERQGPEFADSLPSLTFRTRQFLVTNTLGSPNKPKKTLSPLTKPLK